MYWLNWYYSLTDNFDLSLVNVFNNFDKFVIQSENDVLVFYLKDGFGSCISVILTVFFAASCPRIFRFLAFKNLQP